MAGTAAITERGDSAAGEGMPGPWVALEVSRDGGRTYGAKMYRRIGHPADATLRAEWRRLGIARTHTYRLSWKSAGQIVLLNAFIDIEKANK